MPEGQLRKICDCLDEEHYEDKSRIIRQGTRGDLFFIIKQGDVRITIDQGESPWDFCENASQISVPDLEFE